MHARALAALAAALSCVLPGCSISKQVAVPFASFDVQLQSVVQRAVWFDVILVGDNFSRRLFFVINENCSRMMKEEAVLRYQHRGPWGEVSDDEGVCVPTGIGALAQWRDREGRPMRSRARPRSPGHFRVAYTDEEYVMLRGRFPAAGWLGWTRADDTIAIVPRTKACGEPIERGQAQIQFNATGPEPLEMISSLGQCPIEGLVIPERHL